MKKIFYSLVVSSLITLVSSANELKGTYDFSGGEVSKKLSNESTLLLNCSYESKPLGGILGGVFKTIEFEAFKDSSSNTDSVNINKLLLKTCDGSVLKTHIKDKLFAIKYEDFLKVFNEVNKDKSLKIDTFFYFGGTKIEPNPVINEDWLKLNSGKLKITIFDSKEKTGLKMLVLENYDMKVNVDIKIKSYGNKEDPYAYVLLEEMQQEFLVKEYKYNPETEQIDSLLLDKPFRYELLTYTNTYDIDDIKECIDGKIWIKKYKNLSGDKCYWKKK